MNAYAQAQPPASRTKPGPPAKITLEGKQIAGDDLLVRAGTTYVSLPALARALGASVASQGQVAVVTVPAASENDCGEVPAAKKLSDTYRKAAVRIPEAIETLRLRVNKHETPIPAASFDAVDQQIFEAEFRAQTGADKSVSYALRHANDSLAIMYYKLWRGVPPEVAEEGQLDSVLCSMESKFALQVGRFSGKESCSVFRSTPTGGRPATSN
jgi:hypothetical protein